jgi:GT2 family glycosyltransferase
MKELGIIILNWNGEDSLNECVRSLQPLPPSVDLVVVDNASTDGSIQKLISTSLPVRIIRFDKNYGFAKGYNLALEKLYQEYTFVFLLNNDTRVKPGYIDALSNYLEKLPSNIGMVALDTRLPNGKFDSRGIALNSSGLGFNIKNFNSQPVCPSGGAAVYRSILVADTFRIDGFFFDPDFEFYNEDLDVGLRANLRGWSCSHFTEYSIIHEHSKSMDKRGDSFAMFYSQRNQMWTILKNYPTSVFYRHFFKILLVQIFEIGYHTFHGKLFTVIKAKTKAFCKIHVMIQRRGTVQKMIKISSNDFTKIFAKESLLNLWFQ